MIIDFHTHAFPDQIAENAIHTLESAASVSAYTAGTIDSLLESMNRASINKSVICSIATQPSQFESILLWSEAIRNDRLIPFPSIHPADKQLADKVGKIHDKGFLGIKMHPYYQDFELDDKSIFPFYEALADTSMILVIHCGFDIAYPKTRIADPAKILTVKKAFPALKLVATHFGGWKLWDEVEAVLIGKEIAMEISFALNYLSKDQAGRMLEKHPREYILFGSDSPWDDQKECVQRVRRLGLGSDFEEDLFYRNAERLLLSVS